MKTEKVNLQTGEITELSPSDLNKVIIHETKRKDGSTRIQFDYTNCPTMAEQHTGQLSDVNYLMEKYQPDELAQFLAARNQYRTEILGHDWSQEPDLQTAKNALVESKKHFDELPQEVRIHFRSHLDFIKFMDIPENVQKLINLKILTPLEAEKLKIPEPNQQLTDIHQQLSDLNQNLTKPKTKQTKQDPST